MKDYHNEYERMYFKLVKTGSLIEQSVKKALKPFDLTHAQLNVLSLLFDNHPKPVAPNEIKGQLIVSSPDITRLIDRLYKKGWVNRAVCKENRRKIDITITKNGKAVYEKAHQAAKEEVNDFFEKDLSVEEARTMYTILKKMNL